MDATTTGSFNAGSRALAARYAPLLAAAVDEERAAQARREALEAALEAEFVALDRDVYGEP